MEYIFLILAILLATIIGYRFFILKQMYWTSQYQISKVYSKPNDVAATINRSLKDAKFTHIQDSGNVLFARANATMSSWSEIIRVNYFVEKNKLHVDFISRCAVPVQIFDWGKNRRNAKRFFARLESNLIKSTYS
ncbi:MAG: hypothetical protein ITG00_00430 [Flavobacterium sp.]|nr:hypothetical protein [Flavobacterium sp.]